MNKNVLLFGREPVLYLTLVAVLVQMVGAFLVHLSDNQQAVVNALAVAVVGLLVAFVAHDALSAPILGAIQAAVALAVGFGLQLDAERQSVILAAGQAVIAVLVRSQVTAPVPALLSPPPPVAAPVAATPQTPPEPAQYVQ